MKALDSQQGRISQEVLVSKINSKLLCVFVISKLDTSLTLFPLPLKTCAVIGESGLWRHISVRNVGIIITCMEREAGLG